MIPSTNWIQENLHFLGFAVGPIDGIRGAKTTAGVKVYQRTRGLKDDGIVGTITWAKLESEVKWVQGQLNALGYNAGRVDGLAGPQTKFATNRFQKDYALVPDSIAGSHTRAELERPTRPIAPPTPKAVELPGGLVLIDRIAWGARPPRLVTPAAHKTLSIGHHTVTAQGPDPAAICRSMQNDHMDNRLWNDIAYSFMVDNLTGAVYIGRGLLAVGAHTKGYNTASVGWALIGTYDSIEPSQVALVALRRLNQWMEAQIGPLVGGGHRDYNPTSCPGDRLYAVMPK